MEFDMDDYYYFPKGECPVPLVYEKDEDDQVAIVYDHEGNAWHRPKIKLGFDLTGDE